MENNIYIPYILVTTSTSINGETVWYKNKWKNLLLKIKRCFFKSKNIKNWEKYKDKNINSNFYSQIEINNNKPHFTINGSK